MQAIQISGYRTVPQIVESERPQIGPNEVLVRVTAAAFNPLDLKLQSGEMIDYFPLAFPYTIGTDLAGMIEATGSNVEGWATGDNIIARTDPSQGGAMAEFACVPFEQIVRAPDGISPEHAAGVPTTGGTAWQAVCEIAECKPGQTVLVHAGAGGVGSFAIQFARRSGARVIATASGTGLDIAKSLGADQVIDYRTEDFTKRVVDVDIVVDTIGGETQERSYQVLRKGGKLLALSSPPDESLAVAHGATATFVFHSSDASRLKHVCNAIDDGVRPLIDKCVPFAQFADAMAHQASCRARGKIILTF